MKEPVVIYAIPYEGNEWEQTSFVYLHGKLEQDNGFDLCHVVNLPKGEGIYSALVNMTVDGVEKTIKSMLYLWYPKTCFQGDNLSQMPLIMKGLVCDIDDNYANNDARNKFERKTFYI